MSLPEPTAVPLAIVGIGCLFPKATGLGTFWANVKHGVDAIGPVPASHWRPDDYFDPDPKSPDRTYAQRGGFLAPVDFNPAEFGIAPTDLEATDTSQLLGLVAARDALRDMNSPRPEKSRIAVVLGVTGTLELVVPLGARLGHPHWRRALKEAGVEPDVAEDVVQRIADSYVGWQENSFPGLLGNVVAGRIANRLDLGGTNCVVDAACASSLSAVHLAGLELASGRADVVLTGGADTFNDIFMYMCFSKTPALSPTGNSRPFDAAGDGTILGEGLGVLALKRLADAERDGDRVYAVLRGVGSSSDGKGNAIYAPSSEGQVRCLRNAYEAAGVEPGTVELIEAHGTGTKVGDAAEVAGLAEVFADARGPRVAVGSIKSQIGHTKAAAGAAGLVKAALALYHKVLPPTIKVTKPLETLAGGRTPFYVNGEKRPWLPRTGHPRRAGVSAFGFGGSNFHAVLEEHRPEKAAPDWTGEAEIVALAADTPAGLTEALGVLSKIAIDGRLTPEFRAAAAKTRAAFRHDAACRLLVVLPADAEPASLLDKAASMLASKGVSPAWSLPDGVYCGSGPAPGKLAALFPGQGSQSVGMLRDLACTFPGFLDALAAANGDDDSADRLSDRIYPPTAFSPEEKSRQEATLRATDTAQPALGAVSMGTLRVLESFGITFDAYAGHSYGELPALCAAGAFDEAALHRLSRERGRLMADAGRGGDAGGMLAVSAGRDELARAVADERLNVVVANHNSPEQTVLSGPTAEIDRAAERLNARGMRSVKLSVAAAFHSPLVAAAADGFGLALATEEMRPPRKPVFANTTAKLYPADAQGVRDLLAGQLAKPVEFVGVVRGLIDAGVRTFVEVGPRGVLSKLAEACFADKKDAAAVAVDASAGRRPGVVDLAHTLCRLAARGHAVNLTPWEAGGPMLPPKPARPVLTVPICGANHVKPKPPRPPLPPKPTTTPSANGAANRPAKVPTVNPSQPPTTDPGLEHALRLTQESLLAFQRMQEQAAQLHRQFLDGQDAAQRTFQSLVEQQQQVLAASLGLSVPAPVAVTMPAPVAPPVRASVAPVPPPVVVAPPVAPVVETRPVVAPAPVAPAVPPPPPVETRSAAPRSPTANDRVQTVLVEVVAEKTGYPPEMLDLDMGLDADLGIDSIKRVEILAALQERLPDAPQVKPEHLGTLHTLRHIVAFLAGGDDHVTEGRQPPASADTLPPVVETRVSVPGDAGRVQTVLVEVVAEKTGYPPEMLDLDMGLDADLGIDSIKRVEILAALQERLPDAPQVKPEHLGTLHTLRHIVAFLAGGEDLSPHPSDTTRAEEVSSPGVSSTFSPPRNGEVSSPPLAEEAHDPFDHAGTEDGHTPPTAGHHEADAFVNFDVPLAEEHADEHPPAPPLQRGVLRLVPLDWVRPPVRLPAEAKVLLVADADALGSALADRLRTAAGCTVERHAWTARPESATLDGVRGLVLLAPNGPADETFLLQAFRWVRHVGPALRQDRPSLLAGVSRLDGGFGLLALDDPRTAPAGGLAGIVKTAQHEWGGVCCKAVDLDSDWNDPPAAAARLTDELLTAGPLEVGLTATQGYAIEVAEVPLPADLVPPPLGRSDVVVVVGGARGVTAEAALALAQAAAPTLVILGRSGKPTGEPDWLASLTAETDIKRAILARRPGSAPRQIQEEYTAVMARREVVRNLERLEAAGSRVLYRAVDVRDADAVAEVLADVRAEAGPITGIVHGAGVLADRRIEDKTDEQFLGVLGPKLGGLRALLHATRDDPLKMIALFSSSTGRFGRAGQVDYAAANEALNKVARAEARRRPGCRVVALNWGPWDGGMVTPALAKLFAAEGVGLIPGPDGGRHLVAELTAPDRAVEVVVLGPPPAGGGVALAGLSASVPVPEAAPAPEPPPMPAGLTVAFERELALRTHPILRSHVLNGSAVLPVALMVEWLAHGAMHGNPGLAFHGIDGLRVTDGVRLGEDVMHRLSVWAGRAARDGSLHRVPVELRGRKASGREVVHAKAEVVLASPLPGGTAGLSPLGTQPYPHPVEDAYTSFLFHGPDLRAIETVDGLAEDGIVGRVRKAPAPNVWYDKPLRAQWLADPMVLDGAFQLLILWGFATHGAGSLPVHVGKYRQYCRSFPASVRVQANVTSDTGTLVRAAMEFRDHTGALLARIDDYECVLDASLNEAFRRNQITRGVAAT